MIDQALRHEHIEALRGRYSTALEDAEKAQAAVRELEASPL